MLSLKAGVLSFALSALVANAATVPSNAGSCCAELQKKLPGKINLPGTDGFRDDVSSYYSALEIELVSACRVKPEGTQDVVDALKILTSKQCRFAVRCGGHMPWAGAANIGSEGITIDLRSMRSVTVSKSNGKTIAQVGGGARYVEVYDKLAEQNLIVVGGRSNPVGVGGFLLGGGMSHLSVQHGFSNDNIDSYEVVVADGRVLNASKTVNPDLFWALKAGGTNFGIITKFNLLAYPRPTMWGGFRGYNVSQSFGIAKETLTFMKKQLKDDRAAASVINWGRNPGEATDHFFLALSYLDSEPKTDIFDKFLAIPFINGTDSLRGNTTVQSLAQEVDDAFPGGPRSLFSTITVKADAQMAFDIYQTASKNFEQFFKANKDVSWTASLQTLGRAITSKIVKGSNTQGLTDKDDLLLLNLFVYWKDPADDKAINEALHKTIDTSTQLSQRRGLFYPWKYANYALPDQKVYDSYGAANVKKLREIKAKYDPKKVFDKFWSGGFKL